MRKTKKTLATLAIVSMVLSMVPVQAFADTTSTTSRLYGAGRVETSIAVADAGWTSAGTAILAPAADANLVDALAAAPLAGQENAPILLTEGNNLNDQTKAELAKLKVSKVYVVGAIDQAVTDEVEAMDGVTAVALKGATRYETASKIAAELKSPAGTFVVGANATADALSVASYAAAYNYAIMFDGQTTVGSKTYLVGGQVADKTGAVRLAGKDRYETNKAVVNGLTYKYDKVYVANGANGHLVDSLVASSLAAQTKSPILLTDNSSVSAAADVNKNLTDKSQVVALGGTGVVSDSVRDGVKYTAPAALAVESVSAINAMQIQVKFNMAVDEDTATDVTNYKLQNTKLQYSATLLTDAAELSADGKTVTLTLSKTGALADSKAYALTVGAGIKDAAGKELGKAYTASWVQADSTIPSVTSVEAVAGSTGTKTVTVKFNEPLQNAGTYKIDGQPVAASALSTTDFSGNNEITLTTSQYLAVGSTHTVTVASATDYAGNILVTSQTSFTVAQAGEGKLVSATPSGETTIKLVYDTKIKTSSIPASMGSNFKVETMGSSFTGSSLAVDSTDTTGKTLILTVGTPGYTATNKSIAPSITIKGLEGINGNKIADVVGQTVTLAVDEVKPAFVKATVSDDNKYVLVEMSEAVTAGSVADADAQKLTVVDSDSVDVTANVFGTGNAFNKASVAKADGTVVAVDKNYIKLWNSGANALAKGTYTVTVPAGLFNDTASALSANSSQGFTFTITVSDLSNTTAITVGTPSAMTVNADGTEYFTLGFGTALNSSALNVANYTIDGKALPTGTNILFTTVAKDTVRITLPAGSFDQDATYDLAVFNVQNSAGKTMSSTALKSLAVKDNTAPSVVSAQANGGTITLTLSENVTEQVSADTGVTLVKADGTVVATSTGVSVAGKTATVTIPLSGVDLSKVTVSVVAGAFKDVSANTNATAAVKNLAISDSNVTVPTFTASQVGVAANASDIKLNINNLTAAKTEGVTSYDVYVYGTTGAITKANAASYTVSTSVNVGDVATNGDIVLSSAITKDAKAGTALTFTSGTKYFTVVAKDALGNVEYSTEGSLALDYTAPTVTKLGNGAADVTIAIGGTATLTFNEALSAAGKSAVEAALTAGADQVITYSWNAGNTTLTITGHATNLTTFANDVTANVSDAVGNVSTGLLLVDSL